MGPIYIYGKARYRKRLLKDWGEFTSKGQRYCIVERTNVEVMTMTEQYVPYVLFETKPVSSVGEVNELIAHLSG